MRINEELNKTVKKMQEAEEKAKKANAEI